MQTLKFKPSAFTATLPRLCAMVSALKQDKEYDLSIKEHKERRSMTANAYFWVLSEKLAQAVGSTKEEIYLNAIRDIGVWRDWPVKKDLVDTFETLWHRQGIGWPTEQVDWQDSDTVIIRAYYGSSTYSKRQMARLIDNIVQDCKACDIETMPPDKLRSLIEAHEPTLKEKVSHDE